MMMNSHGVELTLPSACHILKAISAAEQKGSGLRDSSSSDLLVLKKRLSHAK